MPALSTYPKQKVAITFPLTQIKRAKEKAKRELGFNLPELVRYLVADYLRDTIVPQEKLSPKALKRLNKEVEGFYKNDYESSQGYTSAQDLVDALEADD